MTIRAHVLQCYEPITNSTWQALLQPLLLPGLALHRLSTSHYSARAGVSAVGSGHMHVQLRDNCAFNFNLRETHAPRVWPVNVRRTVPLLPCGFCGGSILSDSGVLHARRTRLGGLCRGPGGWWWVGGNFSSATVQSGIRQLHKATHTEISSLAVFTFCLPLLFFSALTFGFPTQCSALGVLFNPFLRIVVFIEIMLTCLTFVKLLKLLN